MGDGFLGTGWKFELSLGDPDGATGVGLSGHRIAEVSEEDNVRQSIWLILSTAPGERVMRPDFGCGIHNLVFATPSPRTMGDVIREVKVALIRWEPRVDVLGVDVHVEPREPNQLVIEIEVQVRSTNSRFNLVYPFYLS